MALDTLSTNSTVPDPGKDKDLMKWQNRLFPWMIAMPTLLIGAFIILGTIKLSGFEKFAYRGDNAQTSLPLPAPNDSLSGHNAEYLKWYSLVKMEEYSINRRYNQGGVLLMSRIYIKYLGFFTGMILAIVGSVFIISKLKEEVSEFEGSIRDQTKFRLVSSSPGIIFGLLGTLLMMTTILTHSEISVKDMPLYLNTYNISEARTSTIKPEQKIKKGKIDPKAIEELMQDLDTAGR